MPFDKPKQDKLEAALGDRAVKEQLLDDMDALINALNAVLVKLDADTGVSDTNFASLLTLPGARVGGKKHRL